MPIIDISGKIIKENDFLAIREMLTGSLESHIAQLDKWKETAENRQEDPFFYERIIGCFRDVLNRLPEVFRSAKEGRNNIKAEDLIAGVYSEISGNVINELGQQTNQEHINPEIRQAINSFLSYNASEWADKGLAEEYPDRAELQIQEKDTKEAYDRTVGAFQYVTEPFKWIEDIDEYDTRKDSVDVLYNSRMPGNAPEEDMVGLRIAGEKSRGYSFDIRVKNKVSFGNLFSILSGLNKAVRTEDATGGKLRGRDIRMGNLRSVGSFSAPVTLYKTLSKIADDINQLKKIEDKALRKSRAIQLAAFSYQMLMSERVFDEANGRTCRLFADTILQSFGLPPHTPVLEEKDIVHTMGEPMDFTAGANAIYNGVQRSNRTLREEKEKDIETVEQKSNKRHDLLEEIRARINDEEDNVRESEWYRNYIQALEELEEKMVELGGLDENEAEKNLTEEDRTDLLEKMVHVGEAGEKFLKKAKLRAKDITKGIYDSITRLQKLLSRDYETITEYNPQNPKSLNELMDDSRVLTIDIRDSKIKTLGNMQNSRIPMTIYGVDGKMRTGVFTKASYVRTKEVFDEIINKASENCNEAAKNQLTLIPRIIISCLVNSNNFRKDDGTKVLVGDSSEYAIGWLVSKVHNMRREGVMVNEDRIKLLLDSVGVNVMIIPDKAITILKNGLNSMAKNASYHFSTLYLFMQDGDRLDHRNSAMSTIASLMGASSLLAKSDNMRYINSKGHVTEGTFMDFGKGLDIGNDISLAKHLREDPFVEQACRGRFLKSLADLKIIDFICLNLDRHEGNVMYQVDQEGNLIGVQGIDNDSSFGVRQWRQEEVRRVRVISKSMNDRLNKITPEILRFALRGSGLTYDEISAAVLRLKTLKNRVKNNQITVFDDNDFNNSSIYDITATENRNNDPAWRTFRYINGNVANYRRQSRIQFEPYIDRTPQKSRISTTERRYTVGGLVDLSEKIKTILHNDETGFDVKNINSYGRRSNEFNEIITTAGWVTQAPDYLRDIGKCNESLFISEPGAEDVRQVYESVFNNLNQAIDRYLNKKLLARGMDEKGKIKGKNDYEQKRIDFVVKIKKVVKDYEARKRGPVKKSEIVEKQSVIKRRDQNIKNKMEK